VAVIEKLSTEITRAVLYTFCLTENWRQKFKKQAGGLVV